MTFPANCNLIQRRLSKPMSAMVNWGGLFDSEILAWQLLLKRTDLGTSSYFFS